MYRLMFDFGLHHIWVETTKESFFTAIDDLSLEFEIHTKTFKRAKVGEPYKKVILYYIINYLGDKQKVGDIIG